MSTKTTNGNLDKPEMTDTPGTTIPQLAGNFEWIDSQLAQIKYNAVIQGGAKADGITDDTSSFQNAVTNNRKVFLPAGTYLIKGAITIPDDTVIYGEGRKTILLVNSSSTNTNERIIGNADITNGNKNITISNLTLSCVDLPDVTNNYHPRGFLSFLKVTNLTLEKIYSVNYNSRLACIWTWGCKHLKIKDCNIDASLNPQGGGACWLYGAWDNSLTDMESYDIEISGNKFIGSMDEGLHIGGNYADIHDIKIYGNTLLNASNIALGINGNVYGFQAYDIEVSDNKITGGVNILNNSVNIDFHNNSIDGLPNNTGNGIFASFIDSNNIYPQKISLSENIIKNAARGIYGNVKQIDIDSNKIYNISGYAIEMGGYAEYNTITRNRIKDCTNGIRAVQNGFIVEDNVIRLAAIGIEVYNSSDVTVKNNKIINFSSKGIHVDGNAGTVQHIFIETNEVYGDGTNGQYGIQMENGTFNYSMVKENKVRQCLTAKYSLPSGLLQYNNFTGTYGELSSLTGDFVYFSGKRITSATSAPTTGTWTQGDICYKANATVGQPIGWICTVSGTPGTWSPMANL